MTPGPVASPLPNAPVLLAGMDFFQAWKQARLLDTHRKPMGDTGLGQAEFIWRKWLGFCSVRQIDWQAAGSGDVQAFAGDISPRKPGTPCVSPVTLRRYWRILNDLYAHAVLSGSLAHNPAAEVMPATSEKTSSLALPPHMWALLQEGLSGGYQFKARRNRLVLLLMMRCALTVTEIISLTLGSVQAHEGTPDEIAQRLALAGLPLLQPESPFWAPLASHPTYRQPAAVGLTPGPDAPAGAGRAHQRRPARPGCSHHFQGPVQPVPGAHGTVSCGLRHRPDGAQHPAQHLHQLVAQPGCVFE